MAKYLCQMIDCDDDADWHEVDAFDSSNAAKEYAAQCKSRSGGEMLYLPDDHRERVRVRLSTNVDGPAMVYEVTMEWVEHYMARYLTETV